MITTILLLAAAICFALAAFNVPVRLNLTATGLFFWVLTHLIPALSRLSAVVLVAGTMLLASCTLGVEAKSGNKYSFSLQPTTQDYKALKELR